MRSLGKRPNGLRLERMKSSARWAGEGFRNVHPMLPGLRDPSAQMPSLSDFLCAGDRRVPRRQLPSVSSRADGYRVLTDPVWGPRASPSRLIGPKRFQPVPVALRALPSIDLVIVSHDHYDHLDYPTIRELAKLDVPFVTSLGVGAHLEAWGVPAQRIVELDWWETHRHKGADLSVTAAPSQHFSGRSLHDRNATLWSSMVIRSSRHAVFFSGDTGLTTEYATIRELTGPFDLIMLEVGGYHPAWGDIHLGPENALQALALLGGGTFLPIHWGTFALATHDWDQPVETLLTLAPNKGVRLLMPQLGEPVEPAHEREVTPWWRAVDRQPPRRLPSEPPVIKMPEAMPWPFD